MGHFAQINEANQVVQVSVAEQDFINTGLVGSPSTWIQTSYNTLDVHTGKGWYQRHDRDNMDWLKKELPR